MYKQIKFKTDIYFSDSDYPGFILFQKDEIYSIKEFKVIEPFVEFIYNNRKIKITSGSFKVLDYSEHIYDFYYSKQQELVAGYNTVNGIIYTCCASKGTDHGCLWTDLKLVYTGKMENIKICNKPLFFSTPCKNDNYFYATYLKQMENNIIPKFKINFKLDYYKVYNNHPIIDY